MRQRGAEELRTLLSAARPLLDVAIEERLRQAEGLSIPDLVSRELIPWLARIQDPLQRDFLNWVAQLAGIERAPAKLWRACARRPRQTALPLASPRSPPRALARPRTRSKRRRSWHRWPSNSWEPHLSDSPERLRRLHSPNRRPSFIKSLS